MKDILSLERILRLIKQYFMEHTYREIMFWGIISLIFTVLDQRTFVINVILISAIFFNSNLLHQFWRGPNKETLIMQPVSNLEKLIVVFFFNSIYFLGMSVLSYAIGNGLIILIFHQLLKINIPINWDLFISTHSFLENGLIQVEHVNEFWSIFGKLAFIQAFFTLGSLSFKRAATTKSFLTMSLMLLGILALQLFIFYTAMNLHSVHSLALNIAIMQNTGEINLLIKPYEILFFGIATPFLWVISYFKLKELEFKH